MINNKNKLVFNQVDYSLNSGFSSTNKVRYSSSSTYSITGVSYYPVVGTYIYKYGNSGGYAYGTIKETDLTVQFL